MGIIKRAGDLVYTFRFLKLLVTNFEDTEAFKLGLIDDKGKKLKRAETTDERDAYTPFHRLVFNVKKLIPGGKFGSYASALYLIKDHYSIPERKIMTALKECGVDPLDFLMEDNKWFVLEDGRLSPGDYRVAQDKLLNKTLDEVVKRKDWVTANDTCYPVGQIFGLSVYEMTHKRTKQPVYVTVQELRL